MAEAKYEPRLKTRICTSVIRASDAGEVLLRERMKIPRSTRSCINMGVGEATADSKKPTVAAADLAAIAGQKPVITRPASPSPASRCAKTCRSAPR